MLPEIRVLTAVIRCPGCEAELEAVWAEPEDGEDEVELTRQLCGSCGSTWTAKYPGYSFKTEAG
jgi:hypothetical protein